MQLKEELTKEERILIGLAFEGVDKFECVVLMQESVYPPRLEMKYLDGVLHQVMGRDNILWFCKNVMSRS